MLRMAKSIIVGNDASNTSGCLKRLDNLFDIHVIRQRICLALPE